MRAPVVTIVIALAFVAACRSGSASDPSPAASTAPSPVPTDSAPCVSVIAEHQRTMTAHLEAARTRTSARDGAGCLLELDAYDRESWDPTPSTKPTSAMAVSRALCMMLAGDCAHGKELYRASMESNAGATLGPEALDRSVDSMGSLYCEGPGLEPRDALLRALMDLSQGAYVSTITSAACQGAIDTVRRLSPVVKPRGPDDTQVAQASTMLRAAGPECLARAGDCEASWRVFHDAWLAERPGDEPRLRPMFEGIVRRCSDP